MARVSIFAGAVVAAVAVAGSTVVRPADAAQPMALDCFADLMRGSSEEIVCEFPLRPNASERADLEKQSRGYVKDATCTVSIRIARSAILAAVHTPDYEFIAPPQPVACQVTAQWREKSPPSVMPISATFAPKVTIRGGKATDATPGLGDVQGVPRALSWPVETWVNSGIGIKGNMLQVINAWLDHMRHTRAGQKQALR